VIHCQILDIRRLFGRLFHVLWSTGRLVGVEW
jgi:hypothetical protein